ncbi:Hypothetical_protein [Hexamita inflata]|uniref:Hypothetical_protein n=1 Tax=Hexamita inflata TaxID=28002 RepID=A0AA86VRR8_9EUKA|nr:Hypothetical protein HINF_LOCUS62508 [Hexamita inflata]
MTNGNKHKITTLQLSRRRFGVAIQLNMFLKITKYIVILLNINQHNFQSIIGQRHQSFLSNSKKKDSKGCDDQRKEKNREKVTSIDVIYGDVFFQIGIMSKNMQKLTITLIQLRCDVFIFNQCKQ